uniref:Uncharacterized protein n=1 Tax=uncultured marine virus TaxID=186617 RepID=A0A0F7LA08_9VIRU|nr:hypothetical protein [uncultured marine virus]
MIHAMPVLTSSSLYSLSDACSFHSCMASHTTSKDSLILKFVGLLFIILLLVDCLIHPSMME